MTTTIARKMLLAAMVGFGLVSATSASHSVSDVVSSSNSTMTALDSTKKTRHRRLTYDTVHTDKTCYDRGEDIEISFDNSHPYVDDWVAVYPADADFHDLGHPRMWLYLCGDQHCRGKRSSGTLVFGADHPDETGTKRWPLAPGDYRAILARNGGMPYSAYATSTVFTVRHPDYPCVAPDTPAPTPKPTPRPTPRATPAPTPAPTTIDTDMMCYHRGQDIKVSFSNPHPYTDDWVGIYYAGADPHELGHPLLWLWTCGDQHCRGKVEDGMLIFGYGDPDESGTKSFPLPAGDYIAVIARNRGSTPYSALAVSDSFEVKPSGESCFPTPMPTRNPTKNPTPMPTKNPTPAPTPMPTPAPVQDDATIDTDRTCYTVGQDILATFFNPNPYPDDWVGVYPESADPHDLAHPLLWLWTCGTQNCRRKVEHGDVTFGSGPPNEGGTVYFPLHPGRYIVVLARNGHPPYSARAVSMSFVVKDEYDLCPGADSITTDKTSYDVGDKITATFSNSVALHDDWVGIYAASGFDPDHVGEPLLWLWTCGTQSCSDSVMMGSVMFFDHPRSTGTTHWPLPVGSYVAVLLQNGHVPYVVDAVSDPFHVTDGY